MIKKTLFLFSVFCFSKSSFSAPNDWRKLNAFGGAKKERAVSFVIGNFGYVGTGVDTAEHVTKDFWQYNPGTDTWTQKASVPGKGRRDALQFDWREGFFDGWGAGFWIRSDFRWGCARGRGALDRVGCGGFLSLWRLSHRRGRERLRWRGQRGVHRLLQVRFYPADPW